MIHGFSMLLPGRPAPNRWWRMVLWTLCLTKAQTRSNYRPLNPFSVVLLLSSPLCVPWCTLFPIFTVDRSSLTCLLLLFSYSFIHHFAQTPERKTPTQPANRDWFLLPAEFHMEYYTVIVRANYFRINTHSVSVR